MIDKDITRRTADAIQALGRWLMETARDIDYASRVLHRIQYDRPWDRLAGYGEGVGNPGPANCR